VRAALDGDERQVLDQPGQPGGRVRVGQDGRIATVNATEVKIAGEREIDAIVTRIVNFLSSP
jgi:hypothetical protein